MAAALGREVSVRLRRRGGAVEIPFDDLAEVREMARAADTPPRSLIQPPHSWGGITCTIESPLDPCCPRQ